MSSPTASTWECLSVAGRTRVASDLGDQHPAAREAALEVEREAAPPTVEASGDPGLSDSLLASLFILVALGNPGVGKSTALNCLVGRPVFQAGFNRLTGLTKLAQLVEEAGKKYLDTPGLDDIEVRKTAAAQIQMRFAAGGCFKILFFVKPNNGRVPSTDLATILAILGATQRSDGNLIKDYGIVVNQIPLHERAEFEGENGNKFRNEFTELLLKQNMPPPFDLFFAYEDARLKGANKVCEPPEGLQEFIDRLPIVELQKEEFGEIPWEHYSELVSNVTRLQAERDSLQASLQQSEANVQREQKKVRSLGWKLAWLGVFLVFVVLLWKYSYDRDCRTITQESRSIKQLNETMHQYAAALQMQVEVINKTKTEMRGFKAKYHNVLGRFQKLKQRLHKQEEEKKVLEEKQQAAEAVRERKIQARQKRQQEEEKREEQWYADVEDVALLIVFLVGIIALLVLCLSAHFLPPLSFPGRRTSDLEEPLI